MGQQGGEQEQKRQATESEHEVASWGWATRVQVFAAGVSAAVRVG
jgi:hypothetical protein